jgi:acyl-CoA synthetase (AMP-forming)/AMP-acid ligase II
MPNSHFVKCKDTSTNREYLIWVNANEVWRTNKTDNDYSFEIKKVNATQAIAWTIQTNVPQGKIAKIIRQGDCILIKPKGKYEPLSTPRHLTEKEYKTLLVAES